MGGIVNTELQIDQAAQESHDSQHALTTSGQRRINLIWEVTQAFIAILLVSASIMVWVHEAYNGVVDRFPEGLSNALFLVVGFYFSRTNHSAIGGTGEKPTLQRYEGR
jgi:hypothetical protein